MSFQRLPLERELEKVNFFPLNFWFVTNTREVMEHFKLLFGSGNSDLAKIRPLKVWTSWISPWVPPYGILPQWYFLISRPNFGRDWGGQAERTPYSSCFPHLHQTEGVRLGQDGSNIATCRGTRDLIVRRSRLCGGRGGGGQRGESTGHQQHFVLTYRYQVERRAGPVEVQRAAE